MSDPSLPTVYPTFWCADVRAVMDVLVQLGLEEVWSNEEEGLIAHAELRFRDGLLSLNHKHAEYSGLGPAGVALRCDERGEVDAIHERAVAAGLEFFRPLEESFVAYGFTVKDAEGNLYWFHCETGNLDALRNP